MIMCNTETKACEHFDSVKVKVKFLHTRYHQALGLELIPVTS